MQLCDNRDIPLIFLQNSSLSNPDELASDAIVLKVIFRNNFSQYFDEIRYHALRIFIFDSPIF